MLIRAINGSGGTDKNRVIFFDTAFSTSVYHGYDAEILDKVSGSFRTQLTSYTEMTFTFKIAGKVKFGAAVQSTSYITVQLNGVSVLNQEADVNIGDTLYVKLTTYNFPVVILNPDITQS